MGDITVGKSSVGGVSVMRRIVCVLVAVFLVWGIGLASSRKGTKGIAAPPQVIERVKTMTGGKGKILGVEKAPFKGFYIVFIRANNGRLGVLTVSEDGKYVIIGQIIDFSGPAPRNIVFDLAKSKGYLKPPKPKKINMSDIDLKGTALVGKKSAPSIVLYFDPTCPFCRKEMSTLKEMVKQGEISFYPKYLIVHGKGAKEKAIEAECIREKLGNEAYFDYIISGKKPKKLPKCDREAISKRIERDSAEAKKIGIMGTPSWIYQGRLYVGYHGRDEIKRIIDKGKNAKVK